MTADCRLIGIDQSLKRCRDLVTFFLTANQEVKRQVLYIKNKTFTYFCYIIIVVVVKLGLEDFETETFA